MIGVYPFRCFSVLCFTRKEYTLFASRIYSFSLKKSIPRLDRRIPFPLFLRMLWLSLQGVYSLTPEYTPDADQGHRPKRMPIDGNNVCRFPGYAPSAKRMPIDGNNVCGRKEYADGVCMPETIRIYPDPYRSNRSIHLTWFF